MDNFTSHNNQYSEDTGPQTLKLNVRLAAKTNNILEMMDSSKSGHHKDGQ